jgi:hypothetical protein
MIKEADLIESSPPRLCLVSQEVEEVPASYRGNLMRLHGCWCGERGICLSHTDRMAPDTDTRTAEWMHVKIALTVK